MEKKEKEVTRKQVVALGIGAIIFVAGFYCGVRFDRFVKRKALDIVYF